MAEVQHGESIEITRIRHPGGVIAEPIKFHLDDSIAESIENVMTDYGLPGNPEDFNLYVTDGFGTVTELDRHRTVEYYLDQLHAYLRIEISEHIP